MENYILVVEDDEEDYQIFIESFKALGIDYEVRWVKNGESCIDFLLKQISVQKEESSFLPTMIFLDLNMPRRNGFEVLHEIRSNPMLRYIPVIILSSSKKQDDVNRSYELGANAYIQKLSDQNLFEQNLDTLNKFWFNMAQMPETLVEKHDNSPKIIL